MFVICERVKTFQVLLNNFFFSKIKCMANACLWYMDVNMQTRERICT